MLFWMSKVYINLTQFFDVENILFTYGALRKLQCKLKWNTISFQKLHIYCNFTVSTIERLHVSKWSVLFSYGDTVMLNCIFIWALSWWMCHVKFSGKSGVKIRTDLSVLGQTHAQRSLALEGISFVITCPLHKSSETNVFNEGR